VARFNLDSKKWNHISTMQNRSKFGIAQVGQEVYLLGGKRDKQRVAIGEVFAHGAVMQSWGLESVRSGFGTVVLMRRYILLGEMMAIIYSNYVKDIVEPKIHGNASKV
jgi:hypothetical protein